MYREISSSDINLGVLEVSKKTVALISLSIVEFLLFNRNQIPFVFEKFQYMVKRLEERKIKLDTDTEGNSVAYAIERHRNIAIGTHKQILEIQNVSVIKREIFDYSLKFIYPSRLFVELLRSTNFSRCLLCSVQLNLQQKKHL